jgi:hypothetical protein
VTIRQGFTEWADEPVGDGTSSFRNSGCLVCCIREAALLLVPGETDADPRITNERGRKAGAFVKSMAIIDKLAAAEGIEAGPRIEGFSVMRAVIMRAILSKELVLLHVDHNAARPHGDEAPDHFVLAIMVSENGITFTDPATGKTGVLSVATLEGPSGWKDGRHYKVKAVRVLKRMKPPVAPT